MLPDWLARTDEIVRAPDHSSASELSKEWTSLGSDRPGDVFFVPKIIEFSLLGSFLFRKILQVSRPPTSIISSRHGHRLLPTDL